MIGFFAASAATAGTLKRPGLPETSYGARRSSPSIRFRALARTLIFEFHPLSISGQVKSASALKYWCTRRVTTSLGIHSR